MNLLQQVSYEKWWDKEGTCPLSQVGMGAQNCVFDSHILVQKFRKSWNYSMEAKNGGQMTFVLLVSFESLPLYFLVLSWRLPPHFPVRFQCPHFLAFQTNYIAFPTLSGPFKKLAPHLPISSYDYVQIILTKTCVLI